MYVRTKKYKTHLKNVLKNLWGWEKPPLRSMRETKRIVHTNQKLAATFPALPAFPTLLCKHDAFLGGVRPFSSKKRRKVLKGLFSFSKDVVYYEDCNYDNGCYYACE
jgi:hypothetical protein